MYNRLCTIFTEITFHISINLVSSLYYALVWHSTRICLGLVLFLLYAAQIFDIIALTSLPLKLQPTAG